MTTTTATPPATVDMFTPHQTCRALGVDETQLLMLVNSGGLAAYDLGGVIRFRRVEVLGLAKAAA